MSSCWKLRIKYWAAISNRFYRKKSQKGSVIIIAMGAMLILLLISSYFLSLSVTEYKISKSQIQTLQTYYIAEAGINEAIWRLKNDSDWNLCFTSSTAYCDCYNWTTSSQKEAGSLIFGNSYTVSIENSSCGNGEITTMASSTHGNQRIVKIKVYKALGSLIESSSVFSGSPSGEITIHASKINIHNGNIFSNNNINIKSASTVNLYDNQSTIEQEGLAFAYNNINITDSSFNSSSTCSKKGCGPNCPTGNCPPEKKDMPAVDFDSGLASSYKNKAINAQNQGQCEIVGKNYNGSVVVTSDKCLFTSSEFRNLLSNIGWNGTLYLNHKANGIATSTYYVTGAIELKGQRKMEINGVLIADGDIEIGEKLCWGIQCGFDQVKVNDPGVGIPSGLLSKGSVNFDLFSSLTSSSIEGIIYAGDKMDLISLPQNFQIVGGIMASKFAMFSVFQPLEFYFDEQKIQEGIWGGSTPPPGGTQPEFSPVITIDHWEELY
ncbi:MAG: hypothetical protein PHI77_01320 [Candidatus Pacebacteria bacterium]|nr:hypothetical protein [Candidatus Paceibacterota bacterium]